MENAMKINATISFQASLDDGLTVTTFPAGEHDVPDWVGAMAMEHYGATKAKEGKKEKTVE